MEDQELRNLHHRVYYSHSCKKKLAACLHCPQEWSAEDLIHCYLKREQGVLLSHFPENDTQKLKSIILHHQIHGQAGEQEPAIVNAAYNHHIHCKNCIDKGSAKSTDNSKSECGNINENAALRKIDSENKFLKWTLETECQHRFPKCHKIIMTIRTTDIQDIQWYKWNGTYETRDILEIVPKRSAYDAFQNLSLNCWNKTKFACITNINLIMPRPVSPYTFKYQSKRTQQEDVQRYDKIYSVLERVLASPDESQTEHSEAYRQVMAGAFAHQNTNVIGAIMASFLI